MATKESDRVDRHRKENFERISILGEKGTKKLLKAASLREGISVTEFIRRAILARIGLRIMPYPDRLSIIDNIVSADEADKAIRTLQNAETSKEILSKVLDALSPEGNGKVFNLSDEETQELTSVLMLVKNRHSISGYEIGILRRILSNIQYKND